MEAGDGESAITLERLSSDSSMPVAVIKEEARRNGDSRTELRTNDMAGSVGIESSVEVMKSCETG